MPLAASVMTNGLIPNIATSALVQTSQMPWNQSPLSISQNFKTASYVAGADILAPQTGLGSGVVPRVPCVHMNTAELRARVQANFKAQSGIKQLLQQIKSIQDEYSRGSALINVADTCAQWDSEKAQDILTQVLSVAKEIQKEKYRSNALCAVAQACAQWNSEEAQDILTQVLSVAKEIQNEADRGSSLIKVAQAYAQWDSKEALGILKQALSAAKEIQDEFFRNSDLIAVAQAYAQWDLEEALGILKQALSTAKEIQSETDRSYALIKVAQAYAQWDSKEALGILKQALSAAKEIQDEYSRGSALINVADTCAQWDSEKAQDILTQVLSVAKEIQNEKYRSYALIKVAQAYAQWDSKEALGILKQALSAAKEIQDEYSRGSALINVADTCAQWDSEKAQDILTQVLSVAKEIQKEKYRSYALIKVAQAYAQWDSKEALGILKQALSAAKKIQDEEHRIYALINVAQAYAQWDSEEALGILKQALSAAKEIQDEAHRSNPLTAVAQAYAQWDSKEALGILKQALSAAKEIQDEYSRGSALINVADTCAQWDSEKAQDILEEIDSFIRAEPLEIGQDLEKLKIKLQAAQIAKTLAANQSRLTPFGGWQAAPVRAGLVHLLESGASKTLVRDMGPLPTGLSLIKQSRPNQQHLARLGQAETLRGEKHFKEIRRAAYRQARQTAHKPGQDFLVHVATLQRLDDPTSHGKLLELASAWPPNKYHQPQFRQLVYQLIQSQSLKGLNFARQLLGHPEFCPTKDSPLRRGHYRFWLLRRLSAVNALQPELAADLDQRLKDFGHELMDDWIQEIVNGWGLTPNIETFEFFMDQSWKDESGQELTSPKDVGVYLLRQREQYAQVRDSSELISKLLQNEQSARLYYFLFGGSTHFALYDRYESSQFLEMLQAIQELGPVHEGVMLKFQLALMQGSTNDPNAVTTRLRAGHWPLGDQPYARAIRVDSNYAAIKKGLHERFASALGSEQLGTLIVASLAPELLSESEKIAHQELLTQIAETQGLIDLVPLVEELKKQCPHLLTKITQKYADKFDQKFPIPLATILEESDFKVSSINDWKNRLRNYRKNLINGLKYTNHMVEIEQLKSGSEAYVMQKHIEFLLSDKNKQVSLVHAEEWQSHIAEVFAGAKNLAKQPSGQAQREITLRYLDKQKDLVESLRFTDAIQNCFTSSGDNQEKWLSRMHKDPLSFAFAIENNAPEAEKREAIGFVFGSMGLKDGRPAVLLNGVYMQGKTNAAVAKILNTIEADFSRPLGATHQFVASNHGGRTEFDPVHLRASGELAYDNTSTEVTRLRALAQSYNPELPEKDIYDDIGVRINEKDKTPPHVSYKELN